MGRNHYFACKKCKVYGGNFETWFAIPDLETIDIKKYKKLNLKEKAKYKTKIKHLPPEFRYFSAKGIMEFLSKHLFDCGVKNIILIDEFSNEYGTFKQMKGGLKNERTTRTIKN